MNDQPGKKRGRKPTLYPYKGRRLSLSELAELSGGHVQAIRRKIKRGMTVEEAIGNDHVVSDMVTDSQDKLEPMSVVYRGEKRTLDEWTEVEWVKRRGIYKKKLYARLFQLGWSKEEAFEDAPRHRANLYPYQGQQVTITELAKISGWSVERLRARINSGMTIEQATTRSIPNPRTADERKKQEPIILSYRGEEKTLEEWAGIIGIPKAKLYARLFQLGWTKEEAFGDAPRQRPNQRIITAQTPDGPVGKTLKGWSDYLGIAESTISRRLSRGWSKEQAMGYEPSPLELRNAELEQMEDDGSDE